MYKRLLVPLDGSPMSEAVLPHAEAIAASFRAESVLLRVISSLEELYRSEVELGKEGAAKEQAAQRSTAEAYLGGIAASMQGKGLKVQSIVLDGPPAKTIRAVAEETEASLIAMSTHSHRGLVRAVLGSVTEEVVRQSRLPVLVVGPQSSAEPGPV